MLNASTARPAWRILHVLFSPRMAGSERYCVDLARQQAAQGHEVHVAGLPGTPMARSLGDAVRFHGLRWPLLRGLRLRQLMGELSVDVCHAHLSPACKALAGAPAHIATVATLHVGYKAHQHDRLSGLVCVNQAQLGRLGGYTGHRRVIPNWLPSSAGAAPGSRQRHRAMLGLSEGTLLVGAVGRLHASKGMDVLISAFRAFAPAHAALVILGEGPQRQALEKLCAGDPRIHLLGFREDVSDFLPALDLFVSPSREESFGLAILEAMACGLPMLATAAEGPSEILRGGLAELVTPGSVAELGLALSRSLAQLRAGGAPRLQYEMQAFEQVTGVAAINDFYAQLMQDAQRRAPALDLQQAHASHV
nr:glycosyltransferase [uncultured Roseateles sp.]